MIELAVTPEPQLAMNGCFGSIRNASTNLAYVSEFAASKGLKRLSLAEWGQKRFHTGEAPAARAPLGVIAVRSRRNVA